MQIPNINASSGIICLIVGILISLSHFLLTLTWFAKNCLIFLLKIKNNTILNFKFIVIRVVKY